MKTREELKKSIADRTTKIQDLRNQKNGIDLELQELMILNHREKVKMKKLEKGEMNK
jgi:hypothetical protein